MVWDPPKEPVNVTRMIIYSFIPILWIYAGWRIQKFWILLGIGIVISIPTGMVLPFPYYLLAHIPIIVFVVRYFARKYNENIANRSNIG